MKKKKSTWNKVIRAIISLTHLDRLPSNVDAIVHGVQTWCHTRSVDSVQHCFSYILPEWNQSRHFPELGILSIQTKDPSILHRHSRSSVDPGPSRCRAHQMRKIWREDGENFSYCTFSHVSNIFIFAKATKWHNHTWKCWSDLHSFDVFCKSSTGIQEERSLDALSSSDQCLLANSAQRQWVVC